MKAPANFWYRGGDHGIILVGGYIYWLTGCYGLWCNGRLVLLNLIERYCSHHKAIRHIPDVLLALLKARIKTRAMEFVPVRYDVRETGHCQT